MTMGKPIRVGLVGANAERGWGKVAHVPAIRAVPQLQLRAVATSRRETADAAAAAFDAPLAFDDVRAMAAHPEIDLVAVAVRLPLHRAIVSAALEAGKPVYCEWPLGNGLAESEALAALARSKGVRCAIGLQGRHSPWINHVRQLVAEGTIGRVLSTTLTADDDLSHGTVDAANAYMLDRANGANPLTIHGGHFLDTLCHVLGEPRALTAVTATSRPEVRVRDSGEVITADTSDQIAVAAALESGAVASIHVRAGRSPGSGLVWEIQGSNGYLRITSESGYLHWRPLTIEAARGGGRYGPVNPPPAELFPLPETVGEGVHQNVAYTYAAFAHDILDGTRTCADFEDAVVRHRTIDAIERSAAAAS